MEKTKKRVLVTGDWHGCLSQAKLALESAGFNPQTDILIHLGDLVDRGPDSYECVQYLIDLQKEHGCVIAIRGNHDDEWFKYLDGCGFHSLKPFGGQATRDSYMRHCQENWGMNRQVVEFLPPQEHLDFFKNQLNYYIDEKNRCFVHGGFNRHKLITEQDVPDIFYWDRDLLAVARSTHFTKPWVNEETGKEVSLIRIKTKDRFKEIYVGHTPVQTYNESEPQCYASVWVLDTGAGKHREGTVTVMDIDTKEFWQS